MASPSYPSPGAWTRLRERSLDCGFGAQQPKSTLLVGSGLSAVLKALDPTAATSPLQHLGFGKPTGLFRVIRSKLPPD